MADSLKFLRDLQICSRIWPFKYAKIICFNKVLLKQQSLYLEDSTTHYNWTWREELNYGLRKTLCLFLNVGKQNSRNWCVIWRWITLCFGVFNVFKTKIKNRLCSEVIGYSGSKGKWFLCNMVKCMCLILTDFYWDWVSAQSCLIKNSVKICP